MRRMFCGGLALLLTTCFLGCGEANVNPAPPANAPETALEAVNKMKEMHPTAVDPKAAAKAK